MKDKIVIMALLTLGVIFAGAGCGSSQKSIIQGQEALKHGNYPAAIRHLERASRKITNNPALYYNLATAHYHYGDLDAAQAALNVALEFEPDNRDAIELCGEIAIGRQKWDVARNCFVKAGKGLAPNAQLLTALALAERGAGNDDVARVRLLQAMRVNRKYAPAYYGLASLYRDRYQLREEALELFEMYVRLADSSSDIHLEKAKTSIIRLRQVLANGAADLPKQHEPQPAVAKLIQDGNRFLTAQQWSKAEKAFSDALAADKTSFAAAYGMANACRAKGDKKKAFDTFINATKLAPNNMDPFYQAALIAYELRDFAEAGRLSDKLIGGWPNWAQAYALMASIRSAEGRAREAQAYAEYFVAIAPAGEQRSRYEAWLKTFK